MNLIQILKEKESIKDDVLIQASIIYALRVMEYEQKDVPVDLDILDYLDHHQKEWLFENDTKYVGNTPNEQDIIYCRDYVRNHYKEREKQGFKQKEDDLPF
tara:strand:+ start:48 stop:350 length:303 start_codon:yes stop_codon:yes gene_type:complete